MTKFFRPGRCKQKLLQNWPEEAQPHCWMLRLAHVNSIELCYDVQCTRWHCMSVDLCSSVQAAAFQKIMRKKKRENQTTVFIGGRKRSTEGFDIESLYMFAVCVCVCFFLATKSPYEYTVYIHIYIFAVKLKTGPRFGGFKVKNWSKFKVKNWSKFFFSLFFPSFIVFLGIFRNTNSATVCQNSVLAKFGGCQK